MDLQRPVRRFVSLALLLILIPVALAVTGDLIRFTATGTLSSGSFTWTQTLDSQVYVTGISVSRATAATNNYMIQIDIPGDADLTIADSGTNSVKTLYWIAPNDFALSIPVSNEVLVVGDSADSTSEVYLWGWYVDD